MDSIAVYNIVISVIIVVLLIFVIYIQARGLPSFLVSTTSSFAPTVLKPISMYGQKRVPGQAPEYYRVPNADRKLKFVPMTH
jgi:hypothetical protein